jgi:hypothetical protein
LDDNVSNSKDFGQSLVDSISRLISETKEGSQEASKEEEEDVP